MTIHYTYANSILLMNEFLVYCSQNLESEKL